MQLPLSSAFALRSSSTAAPPGPAPAAPPGAAAAAPTGAAAAAPTGAAAAVPTGATAAAPTGVTAAAPTGAAAAAPTGAANVAPTGIVAPEVAAAAGAPANVIAPVEAGFHATIAPALVLGPQPTSQSQQAIIANVRNHSYHALIQPSMFIDPGPAPFFIAITLGCPLGIITDLPFFFELIKRNAKMKYGIYGSYLEARTHYEVEFDNNSVKFKAQLAVPLPSVAPGSAINPIFVSSAAPTPVRAPVARVPRNRHLFPHTVIGPRVNRVAGAQDAGGSNVQPMAEDHSAGAPPSSPTRAAHAEEDPLTQAVRQLAESLPPSSPPPASPSTNASGNHSEAEVESENTDMEHDSERENEPVRRVRVITNVDDPRLSRIPKYPKFGLQAAKPNRDRSGRFQSAPPPSSLPPQQVIVTTDADGVISINPVLSDCRLGRDADPSRDFKGSDYPEIAPNPFQSAAPNPFQSVPHTSPLHGPSRSTAVSVKSKKRSERPVDLDLTVDPFDAGADAADNAAIAKKRRYNVIRSAMSKEGKNCASGSFGPIASTSASASTSAPAPTFTLSQQDRNFFAGAPITPASSHGDELTHELLDNIAELAPPTPSTPKSSGKRTLKGKGRQQSGKGA